MLDAHVNGPAHTHVILADNNFDEQHEGTLQF